MTSLLAVLATIAQDGPDIIPDPSDDGSSNVGGLVVVGVLLVGWLVVGYVLYRRNRRRP